MPAIASEPELDKIRFTMYVCHYQSRRIKATVCLLLAVNRSGSYKF